MANKTLPAPPVTSTATFRGKTVEVMSGLEIRDKATLEGLPFLMTAVKPMISKRQVPYLQIEAEDETGNKFTFQDSSTTGVMFQLETYIAAAGAAPGEDGWITLGDGILAPEGLRVSEYDTVNSKGQPARGKTHYLTTDGRRN